MVYALPPALKQVGSALALKGSSNQNIKILKKSQRASDGDVERVSLDMS